MFVVEEIIGRRDPGSSTVTEMGKSLTDGAGIVSTASKGHTESTHPSDHLLVEGIRQERRSPLVIRKSRRVRKDKAPNNKSKKPRLTFKGIGTLLASLGQGTGPSSTSESAVPSKETVQNTPCTDDTRNCYVSLEPIQDVILNHSGKTRVRDKQVSVEYSRESSEFSANHHVQSPSLASSSRQTEDLESITRQLQEMKKKKYDKLRTLKMSTDLADQSQEEPVNKTCINNNPSSEDVYDCEKNKRCYKLPPFEPITTRRRSRTLKRSFPSNGDSGILSSSANLCPSPYLPEEAEQVQLVRQQPEVTSPDDRSSVSNLQAPSPKVTKKRKRQVQIVEEKLPASTDQPAPSQDFSLSDFNHFDDSGLCTTTNLESLLNFDIKEDDIQKLKREGFVNVESVARASKKRLLANKLATTGFKESTVEKIKNAAAAICPSDFTTAADISQKRHQLLRISTGCKSLDKILGGGVELGSITEFYGPAGVGKTQLCYMLLVTNQLNCDAGGTGTKSMYIHCKPDFATSRIVDIASHHELDKADVLKNVIVGHARCTDMLMRFVALAMSLMEAKKLALLVIDAPASLFRSEYLGRAELYGRQAALGQLLRKLHEICHIFNAACVLTNEVYSSVDNVGGFRCGVIPVGGNIMAHNVTTRVKISRGVNSTRLCQIENSPNLAPESCSFRITQNGIEDSTDTL